LLDISDHKARTGRLAGSRLDAVFRPRSIALIGVSADPHQLNGMPLRLLRKHGFAGEIFLVNPKYDVIDDLPCYQRIDDVPGPFDLAFCMLPAAHVPDALRAAAKREARAAIVLSSGFEEVEGGGVLAAEVKDVCLAHDIALIGPNCEGVWSIAARAILTFGSAAQRDTLHHAPLAIVSQSGAMSGAVARHLQDAGYGCSYVVSVGNETVVTALDVVDYLIDQPDVRTILLFIEGLRDGARLAGVAARAAAAGITIVALKSGNSAVGQVAAASHTGKIATPFAIYRDAFAQHGIIAVQSLVDLLEAGQVLLTQRPIRKSSVAGGGVSVCSVPGGTRALTADLCAAHDVPLAEFSEHTVQALAKCLPVFGYARNPADVTGQLLSKPGMLDEALEIVAREPRTEALLVQLANRGPRDLRERRDLLARVGERHRLPIVVSMLADALPESERREYAATGISIARDPADAVRYLSLLYARDARTVDAPPPVSTPRPTVTPTGWAEMADWLERAGIPVVPWRIVPAGADAAVACRALGLPIVLKALPETLEHKTEAGAVRLNLSTPQEATEAAKDIRALLGRPDAPLLAQAMVRDGVEVSVAAMRNPDFGNVLAIGSGGVFIELFADIGYLTLPATPDQVERAIERLRLKKLLDGFRGAPAADRKAMVDAVVRFGQAFLTLPKDCREFEINPLIVRPGNGGVLAVDALATRASA
jgi:acetate---CoA ligase (ADP-forming)